MKKALKSVKIIVIMRKEKRKRKLTRYLGWIFTAAVVIPSSLLVLIAVRAINREEAYIEKRLESSMLAELTFAVTKVNETIESLKEELIASAPAVEEGEDLSESLLMWQTLLPLAEEPFFISADGRLLWPPLSGAASPDQVSFLEQNRAFLANKIEVPVFKNIALTYKDEIMLEQENKSSIQAQQAITQFRQSKDVRKKAYEQAEEQGQKALTRTVSPLMADTEEMEKKQRSMFITEDLHFNEITASEEAGIIPRFIEESLTHLFWKKQKNGSIVGCILHKERLYDRLISVLPDLYTKVRILTLLNEWGSPLIAPEEDTERDYSKPFVAQEINEILPRWEAAVYLTDPDIISSKAYFSAVILWSLISILFISILSGGYLVLRALRSEMILAGQKTSFVANVSHELKTPLTSIRMFAEMLKEHRQQDEEKQQQYLSLMVSETERLARLVNNVLDFSRIERGEKHYTFKPVDIGKLYIELMENQQLHLKHKGFRLLDSPINTPLMVPIIAPIIVQADPESLKQALLNLLSNAEKYSTNNKEIEVALKKENTLVLIEVKDRGRGIPPDQVRHIFKEFYRGDDALTSRVKGTGLGLSIARRIIRDHGGDIHYYPRKRGGSIFQITLPIIEED